MSEALAIALDDVSVDYVAHAERGRWRRRELLVPALADIDLQVEQGGALGIVGHNGSGKSTLLQVIAGLIPPSSGTVLVSSQPQLLGVRAAVNPLLSGRRNIELCCLALAVPPSEVQALSEEIAAFTELDDFLELPVSAYSAGMMQRLSFSISAAVNPRILLVDEALTVGDHSFKQKCLAKLRSLRDDAAAVVLATHAIAEIHATCTRALWLHEGRIEMIGDPIEVTTAYSESTKLISRKLR